MKVDLTYDKEYIICSSDYPYELQLIKRSMTREIDNAWMLKKKQPHLNTERCFINEYGMVPTGLWLYLLQFCKECNIACEMSPAFIAYVNQFQLDYEQFEKYVNVIFDGALAPVKDKNGNPTGEFKPFKPRQYQTKAAYTLLKYRKSCGEISTSAGKTLISFIVFKYLVDTAGQNKVLYIVPNVDLATQSAERYYEYESYLKNHTKSWEIGILKSGLKKKEKEKVESCNILFGTYQSLNNKDHSFFNNFSGCIVDEAHHATNKSIKTILTRCTNLQSCIGITGTFPKKTSIGYLTLQSYIGPVVYTLTADQLINEEKAATPVYIVFQIIDWMTIDEKRQLFYNRMQKLENPDDATLGAKLLRQEQDFVNNSYTRLKFIGDLAIKMAKNTLILFGDVGGGYGKKIMDYIKDNSEKDVYYIDGSTPTENRDYYKNKMAEDSTGKTIIVGSIYTMGEGIDVPNIESIFLVNTAKSERVVRQIVGRGLRNSSGKTKCIVYDFVDDGRYTEDPAKRQYYNYMWNHYTARKNIYKEQNFPVYEQKYKFQ